MFAGTIEEVGNVRQVFSVKQRVALTGAAAAFSDSSNPFTVTDPTWDNAHFDAIQTLSFGANVEEMGRDARTTNGFGETDRVITMELTRTHFTEQITTAHSLERNNEFWKVIDITKDDFTINLMARLQGDDEA